MKKVVSLCDQCQKDIPDGKGISITARRPIPPEMLQYAANRGQPAAEPAEVVLTNEKGVATFKAGVDVCSLDCLCSWAGVE